ncbi:MAG: Hsp20/alpha crystallin family protein [Victivallaceae bacterium]
MLARINDNWGLLTPWRNVNDLQKEFWGLFDNFNAGLSRYRANYPKITVDDQEKDVIVKMSLPGYDASKLDVEVVSDFLTVRGERIEPALEKDEKYIHRERSFGAFEETIKLPSKVKSAKTKASYTNGMLEIVLPKEELEKPRSIKVIQ